MTTSVRSTWEAWEQCKQLNENGLTIMLVLRREAIMTRINSIREGLMNHLKDKVTIILYPLSTTANRIWILSLTLPNHPTTGQAVPANKIQIQESLTECFNLKRNLLREGQQIEEHRDLVLNIYLAKEFHRDLRKRVGVPLKETKHQHWGTLPRKT